MAEKTFGMRHALVIAIAVSILSLHGGAADRTEEWRFYGGDQGAKRYSPLEQIDKDTVKNLRIVWRQSATPHEMRQDPDARFRTSTTTHRSWSTGSADQLLAMAR